MGRYIVLLMGLAIVAFAAKYALTGGKAEVGAHTEPRRQLDNVRQAASQYEKDAQKAADELAKKAEAQ